MKMLDEIKEWIDLTKYMIDKYGVIKGLWYAIPVPDAYYTVRSWFLPYNVIKIETLPKTWQDRVETLLHANFQILVDFVEKEMYPDSPILRRLSGVNGQIIDTMLEMQLGPFIFIEYERSKHNLEEMRTHLIADGHKDDMVEMHIKSAKRSNEIDLEIVQLYYWWKYVYPHRDDQDPIYAVESPERDFVPSETTPGYFKYQPTFKDAEHEAAYNKALKDSNAWEEFCQKECEEMLIRLIKLRRSLWT
jgi:hypothetical protein